jgi:aminopeptidase
MLETFTPELQRGIKEYAQTIVDVAVNLQRGQTLCVKATDGKGSQALVEALTAVADDRKCPVEPWIVNEHDRHDAMQEHPKDAFKVLGQSRYADTFNEAMGSGAALLDIKSEHPGLMDDVDPKAKATYQRAYGKSIAGLRAATDTNKTNFSIVCGPSDEWAASLFPTEQPETQRPKLWQAIFTAALIDQPDPRAEWQITNEALRKRAVALNKLGFAALKLVSEAAGTELMMGLPEGHIWRGSLARTPGGVRFMPNFPSYEVFTMPHRGEISGSVTSTQPLVYGGFDIPEGILFDFKKGKPVNYTAGNEESQGELKAMFQIARRLRYSGEIGLVGCDSPIARTGVKRFGTILYEENRGIHIAFGDSYPETVKRGEKLTQKALLALGGNVSNEHFDVIVGDERMNVYGVWKDRSERQIMQNGLWLPLKAQCR